MKIYRRILILVLIAPLLTLIASNVIVNVFLDGDPNQKSQLITKDRLFIHRISSEELKYDIWPKNKIIKIEENYYLLGFKNIDIIRRMIYKYTLTVAILTLMGNLIVYLFLRKNYNKNN